MPEWTNRDADWARMAWRRTLARCLISLVARLERDAQELRRWMP